MGLFASSKKDAFADYAEIVERARNPVFYSDYHVPDTLDGRFEMIVLQLFLLFRQLEDARTGRTAERIRLITEAFIYDMDRSLREMGVGDTGVGKRVKAMISAFYGRHKAYEEAWADKEALALAFHKNIYAGEAGKETQAHALARFIQQG